MSASRSSGSDRPRSHRWLKRDCSLSSGVNWSFRPWLFVHDEGIPFLVKGISKIGTGKGESRDMPDPLISTLEMVVPWKYKTWNRVGEPWRPCPGVVQFAPGVTTEFRI